MLVRVQSQVIDHIPILETLLELKLIPRVMRYHKELIYRLWMDDQRDRLLHIVIPDCDTIPSI